MSTTIMINKIKHIIHAGAVITGTMLALASCGDKPYELDLPLAVTSHKLDLSQSAGSTHIMVYSTGGWTAEFSPKVPWASLNKVSGEGNSDLVFTYSANYGVSRVLNLILNTESVRDTIRIVQAGKITEPSLSFKNAAISLLKTAATITTPIKTNLLYNLPDITGEVLYLGVEGDTLGIVSIGKEPSTTVDAWVKNVKVEREGVRYEVEANSGDLPRIAVLKISIADANGIRTDATQTITQGLSGPEFKLDRDSTSIAGYNGTYLIPSASNNIYSYVNNIEYSIVPEGGDGWIRSVSLSRDGLNFSVTRNETGAARSGSITVTYRDAAGNAIEQSLSIDQDAYPAAISFSAVRSMAPGTLTEKQYIEGYVVSDPGSANIAQNRQIAQFRFDYSENYKTAYIESLDGRYGFMLKFDNADDNILERYAKVRIVLAGATLVRELEPERYTLTGLTADNIIEMKAPDSFLVPAKKKSIQDLTDEDLYTMVTLTNVEVLCKDGSFTNAADGYSIRDVPKGINPKSGTTLPRWDTAPLVMSDKAGDAIYMLTNSYVPWRRDGRGGNNASVVPQGSGSFVGIVVHEDHARYGDLGRYQVRAMTKSDIALNGEKFSRTLVEWNWNDKVVDLIPEEGSGEFNVYGATTSGTPDYNSTLWHDPSGTNMKGLISNAGLKLTKKWWDFANNAGNYFEISFSTKGISGENLIMGLVWNHGDQGTTTLDSPAHWKLLYSVDGGAKFMEVPGCGIIKNRSIVWWSTTSQDSCPGFKDHVCKLPSDCFGKEKVVLRFQVADKVTDIIPGTSSSTYLTNLGIEKGILTDRNTGIRIGTLTIRYN